MTQKQTNRCAVMLIAVLLLMFASPAQANAQALCVVTVTGLGDYETFAEALADNNCSTIEIRDLNDPIVTGNWNINRDLVIDGSGGSGFDTATFAAGNNGRIFHITSGNVDLRLIDMVISNGNATDVAGDDYGGAIYNSFGSSTITLENVVVHSNRAIKGGAIYSLGALSVQDAEFYDNEATGAIEAFSDGGAIFVDNTLDIADSLFRDNDAEFGGGAIFIGETIAASNNPNSGTITNSTFTSNTASVGGALLVSLNADMTVTDSTFYENTSINEGSAINTRDGSVTLIHSTVSGNTGSGALGLIAFELNKAARLELIHSTIVDNGTMGVSFLDFASGTTTLDLEMQNSIVAGHTTDCKIGTTSGTGNLTAADHALAPLANNGGITLTRLPTLSSPFINTIPSGTNGCGTTYTSDQRGVSRPQASLCDIGATEYVCGASAANVADSNTLTNAISCFNARTANSYTITITDSFNYTQAIPTIDNSAAALIVEGDGYTLDGADGYQLFNIINTDVTLSDMTLQHGDGFRGGAISAEDATVTISQLTLQDNDATYGAGLYVKDSDVVISQSTFATNFAVAEGGGIYHETDVNSPNTPSTEIIIGNSTFSNNSALNGGGIYQGNNTRLTATHITVANNTARGGANRGGGILDVVSTMTIRNSLFDNNGTGGDCAGGVDGTEINNTNIDSDGSCASAIQSNSINLGALQDNGGATWTHALPEGSSAIDAADAASCAADPINAVDQRGSARDDGPCDVGAYEAACIVSPFAVDSTYTFNRAIHCHNSSVAGSSVISVTQNVLLNAQPPIITNRDVQLLVAGNGNVINGSENVRPISVEGAAVTIENITLQNGRSDSGGAIYIGSGGTVTITQSILSQNWADTDFGGAIFVDDGGALSASHVILQENVAQTQGGAISSSYSATQVDLSHALIQNNRAALGGGMFNGGNATIEHSTFYNNTSTSHGGAFYNNGSATLLLLNSTFDNNGTNNFGGGIVFDGNGTIEGSTFTNNSANRGGAILAFNGDLVVANSTLSGNTGNVYGGGLGNAYANVTLRHVTVTDNSAPSGAGVASLSDFEPVTKLDHTLVVGNTGGADVQVINDGPDNTFSSQGYNVVGTLGTTAVLGGIGDVTEVTTPQVAVLADNGCTLQHTTTNGLACVQTQALLNTSVAVDAGNTTCTDSHDQRGASRPQGLACDAGAFELSYSPPTITSTNSIEISENQTNVVDVESSDMEDAEGSGLLYSISGGADQTLFTIDVNEGDVTFNSAPDFENPTDDNMDNVYHLEVTVTDSTGWTDVQAIAVTVTDILECPGFPMSAGDSTELNNAIACYNRELTGSHTISLTQNITLAAHMIPIINTNGSTLTVAGNGHTIDGDLAYQAFVVKNSHVEIEDITVQNAVAGPADFTQYRLGGGLLIYSDATAVVAASTFSYNTAYSGGGIHNRGNLTIVDSTIAFNNVTNNGGGIYNYGFMTLLRSTIHKNNATYLGGGVFNVGEADIVDSTISQNGALRWGGGIFNGDETVITIKNSTIFDNSADEWGHEITNFGELTASNSILFNAMGNLACRTERPTFDIDSSNLASDTSCGSATQTANIALGPLQDNGGPTWTHALLPGSDAIDAGDAATCTANDQSGVARLQGASCDVGAYELWQLVITAVNANNAQLSWQGANPNCTFAVYESTTPYFTPTGIATYPNVSSIHPLNGRLGDPATNYFFINRATCTNGVTFDSNEVGAFDFEIVPGS